MLYTILIFFFTNLSFESPYELALSLSRCLHVETESQIEVRQLGVTE